ncbi:MAG: hypothetical protein AAF220_14700, partial [Pseudomonadota bacterium]
QSTRKSKKLADVPAVHRSGTKNTAARPMLNTVVARRQPLMLPSMMLMDARRADQVEGMCRAALFSTASFKKMRF